MSFIQNIHLPSIATPNLDARGEISFAPTAEINAKGETSFIILMQRVAVFFTIILAFFIIMSNADLRVSFERAVRLKGGQSAMVLTRFFDEVEGRAVKREAAKAGEAQRKASQRALKQADNAPDSFLNRWLGNGDGVEETA